MQEMCCSELPIATETNNNQTVVEPEKWETYVNINLFVNVIDARRTQNNGKK
uniref:Uncharacterized protein n=1 Tax=Anguilla anguilla TaxID=7936 RepID=A0A0E9RCG9_ANGAN